MVIGGLRSATVVRLHLGIRCTTATFQRSGKTDVVTDSLTNKVSKSAVCGRLNRNISNVRLSHYISW